MSFKIETYRPNDADSVARLWNECLSVQQYWNEPTETIARQQIQQPSGFFVARFNGDVIGTCIAGYDGIRGWLYRVVVSPQHRGQGIGRQLTDQAVRYLRALGCVKVNLQVLASNETAVRFYESQDFYRQDHVSMAKVLARSEVTVSDAGETGMPKDNPSAQRNPKTLTSDNPTLETFSIGGGLCLTSFQASDKSFLCTILNETEIYARHTTLPYPYLESHADNWLRKWCTPTGATLSADRAWAIRDVHDCLIGAIGLHEIQSGHAAELGYWLSTTWWGQGVATRAVDRICQYAFENLQLVRISAEVVAGNTASVRVLQKNRFEQEGILRRARKYGDEFTDLQIFSRIQEQAD